MNSSKTNEFKVGDLVEFMEYTDESEWESQYGLNVGDMVKVVSVERDSFTVRSKTGYLVWTDPSQVVKCCKDNLEKSEDASHTNKFKVGDKVKVISLDNTDDNLGLTEVMYCIGDESVVETVETCDTVTLRDEYLYHVSDLELVKDASETSQVQGELDVATKEMITSSNESIKKTLYSPLVAQQAGDHYKKRGIQPIEYGLANNLSFPQVNVVKYITRHEDKNGLDDLAKSIHYHFFEALRVYGVEGSDELRNKVLKLLGVSE